MQEVVMHRNAEIWAKRYELLENLRDSRLAQFRAAKRASLGIDAHRVAQAQRRFLERWIRLEVRVWHALCVAKGWRKA